jgi:hypothetical protein
MMTPDVRPWYRHRWPWFILALLGSSVAGSLATAWLALSHPDVVLERTEDAAAAARAQPDADG